MLSPFRILLIAVFAVIIKINFLFCVVTDHQEQQEAEELAEEDIDFSVKSKSATLE